MRLRIWTTDIVAEREEEYLAFAKERSREMFLAQPGCLGVLFLKASDGKHAACSFWTNSADVDALASSLTYKATVSDLEASGLLIGNANTRLYEIEGGGMDAHGLIKTLASEVQDREGNANVRD